MMFCLDNVRPVWFLEHKEFRNRGLIFDDGEAYKKSRPYWGGFLNYKK
jgi:hypothetical protein